MDTNDNRIKYLWVYRLNTELGKKIDTIRPILTAAGAYFVFFLFITIIAVASFSILNSTSQKSENIGVDAVQSKWNSDLPLFDIESMQRGWFNCQFLLPWYRWDTVHYLVIARLGYGKFQFSTAWPPLYPFMIKLLSIGIKPAVLASLIATGIATLLYFILFYTYIRRTRDPETARGALFWVTMFPTSFFLYAGYSESLYLVFAVAVLLAARSGNFLQAGLLAALATLARHQGILLTIPIAIYAFKKYFRSLNKDAPRLLLHLTSTSYPLICFSLFAVYVKFGLQYPWEIQIQEIYWGSRAVWPWVSLWNDLQTAFNYFVNKEGFFQMSCLIDPVITLMVMILLVIGRKHLDLAENAYSWATIILFLSRETGLGQTMSLSRFMLSVFPVFILMPVLLKGPRIRRAFLIAFSFCANFFIAIFRMGFFVA